MRSSCQTSVATIAGIGVRVKTRLGKCVGCIKTRLTFVVFRGRTTPEKKRAKGHKPYRTSKDGVARHTVDEPSSPKAAEEAASEAASEASA